MLVVDDEPQIVRGLKVVLRQAGFEVDTAATKSEALDRVAVRPPELLVLDLILPDGSGVEVCEEVRGWSKLPIIVLSAVGDEREKVRALDAGADDYLTKPFGADELLARLRALMRRSGDGGQPVISLGDLSIDVAGHTVMRAGEEIHLTPLEFDILRVLALHAGKLVTHRQLLQRGVGAGIRRRDALPAGAHRAHPREARAGRIEPSLPGHRPWCRLPAARACLTKSLRARPKT